MRTMMKIWFISLVWTIALIIHAQVFGAGFFEQGTGPPGGYPSVATFTHVGTGDIIATDNITSAKGFFSSILRRGGFDVLTSNDNAYTKQSAIVGLLSQPVQGKNLSIDNSATISNQLTVDNTAAIGNNLPTMLPAQKSDLTIAQVTSLTVPRSTSTEEYEVGIGLTKEISKTGTASTDVNMMGLAIEPRIGPTNTRDWNGAFAQVGIFTTNHIDSGATGVVSSADGLLVSADIQAMNIVNRYGIRILAPTISGTGQIDYLYGLYVGSQGVGAGTNYGIYNNDSPIHTLNSKVDVPALRVLSSTVDAGVSTAIQAEAQSSADNTYSYAIIVPPDKGKVGIGTTSPTRKLEVVVSTTGAVNDIIAFATAAAGGFFGVNETDNVVYLKLNTDATYGWQIQNHNGTPLVTVSNAGAVRIHNLTGTGTRPVVASPTGVLSAP